MTPAILALLATVGILFFATKSEGTTSESGAGSGGVTPREPASAGAVPTGWSSSAWQRYDYWFAVYGAKWEVDPAVLKAIALNESSLGTDPWYLANGKGSRDGLSWGLMQMQASTASDMAGYDVEIEELRDDEQAIEWAAHYVWWLGRYKGIDHDLDRIILSYNGGLGNVLKGKISSGAREYLARFQRNLAKVNAYT